MGSCAAAVREPGNLRNISAYRSSISARSPRILLAIRWAWKAVKGVDAMGLGDVKMLAMIGAFFGWQQVWLVLLLSSFTGAILGIVLTATAGRSMQSRLPFGTFLAIAALVASLTGERIIAWHLGLLQLAARGLTKVSRAYQVGGVTARRAAPHGS